MRLYVKEPQKLGVFHCIFIVSSFLSDSPLVAAAGEAEYYGAPDWYYVHVQAAATGGLNTIHTADFSNPEAACRDVVDIINERAPTWNAEFVSLTPVNSNPSYWYTPWRKGCNIETMGPISSFGVLVRAVFCEPWEAAVKSGDSMSCEGRPQPDSCNGVTNNPVQVTTGNKVIVETDFNLTSESGGLEFKRTWNSNNPRWTFSYRQHMYLRDFVGLRVVRPDGSFEFFDTGFQPEEPDLSSRVVIDPVNGHFVYTSSDGDIERYVYPDGRLVSITKPNGKGISLEYIGENTINVSDSYNNTLQLTLDDRKRVVSMIDPENNEFKYLYHENGAYLEYVIFPDDTPSQTGSNPLGEDNPYREYQYDDFLGVNAQRIINVIDENGVTYKTVEYDEDGRVTLSGLSTGSIGSTNFNYQYINDELDPRVTTTNAIGKDAVYHLEEHFGSVKVKQLNGLAHVATDCLADISSREYYSSTGWLESKIDKAGNVTYYEYYDDVDRYGQLKKRIEGQGSTEERTYTFDWYPDRQKKQEILENVKQTDYTYHPNGRLHTRTETDLTGEADVTTRIWTHEYTYHDSPADTQVHEMTVKGPRAVDDDTVMEYSVEGYRVKVTNAEGLVTEYLNHNGRGQPGQMIDANGIKTNMEYHPRGWLEKTIQDVDGAAAETVFGYDNVGQLTSVTLADGVQVQFRYDAAHRLYETENDLGEILHYELDAAGNQTEVQYKDDQGTEVQDAQYDFDGLSRLWKEFGSSGQLTTYTHDEKDHLTTIDDGVNPVTEQYFDAHNRLKQVEDANDENLFMSYDAEDRIDQVTDQRGLVTNYIYDGFGDLQRLESPDTGTTLYDYDAAGNRTKMTDARGVVTDYTYDKLNRLKTVTYPDTAKNVTYTYDNGGFCIKCNGRLRTLSDASGDTHYFYDNFGRTTIRSNEVALPGGGNPVVLTTVFDYNAAGRLKQIQYPNGHVVDYIFDDAGQVDTVTYEAEDPNNPGNFSTEDIATDITYRPFGPLKTATYGNNLELDRVYDMDGRLDTQTLSGTEDVQDLDYGYDLVNNVDTIDNLLDDSRDEDFEYDNLNRLESADGKYGSITYTYDEVGNRKSRTIVRDALTIVETYYYAGDPNAPMDPNEPNSNRLKKVGITEDGVPTTDREFTYDAAGNLTEEKRDGNIHMRPQYDDTNRMERVDP